jgi:hypothetical protein
MKKQLWIMLSIVAIYSQGCSSGPHQSYRSNNFHNSIKSYDKVADVVTDQHRSKKKKLTGNAGAYNRKQAKNLKRQKQKEDAVFMLY